MASRRDFLALAKEIEGAPLQYSCSMPKNGAAVPLNGPAVVQGHALTSGPRAGFDCQHP